jgi:hypothetical protein
MLIGQGNEIWPGIAVTTGALIAAAIIAKMRERAIYNKTKWILSFRRKQDLPALRQMAWPWRLTPYSRGAGNSQKPPETRRT